MIMTVSDLDKMKVQDMPPFENAYERFMMLLEDFYISKSDGEERIKHELEKWDDEAKIQIINQLKKRCMESGIEFSKFDLLKL